MKKAYLFFTLIFFVVGCSKTTISETINNGKFYCDNNQIINFISKEANIEKNKIIEKYIMLEYEDIDEDPDLELLLSYRYEIHKGFFFIYDYSNKGYSLVFKKPWAVEKVCLKEIIAAQGNENTHILTAYIIQMINKKVNIIWSGIYDKFDYSNMSTATEIHGRYYIDTNSTLIYFYKKDKVNEAGISYETQYASQKYIWNNEKNQFVLQ